MDENINYWIGGFIAGEAHFSFYRPKRGGIVVQLSIGLHENDTAVLEMIQQVLGGIIYKQPSKKAVHYRVSSKKEVAALITFCDKYLLPSHKREQYMVWKAQVMEHKSHWFI